MKGCLVCMIGLPGCGKTTLTALLERGLLECGGLKVKVMSFDKEMPWTEDGDWKEKRKGMTRKVEEELDKARCIAEEKTSTLVIILDDNNYYRSMRYEYYKLARVKSIGFFQIFIEISKAEAERKNSMRTGTERVPNEVIERMVERLEAPNPGKHPWESRGLTLVRGWSEGDVKAVVDMVKFAVENPPPPMVLPSCRPPVPPPASALHIADLALRALVRDSDTRNRQSANLIRKSILGRLKSGEIQLPEDTSNSDLSFYYEFLEPLFNDNS